MIIQYTDGNTTKTRAIVNKWKFQDAMMGEQFISFTVTSEKPIDWAIGDYCVFRGETFTLNNIPSVVQKARTGERQDAYTYENVKLESRQEELTRVIMLDITPTTGEYVPALGTNYTGSSKFQLFCGETSAVVSGVLKTFTAVCALAAKIQANLDRFFGADVWHIYVDTTSTYTNASGQTVLVTHTEDKVMTFDNTTVAQALSEVHNTFDLNYSVSGRDIYIGYSLSNLTSETPENTFDFGYGKGYPTPLDSGKALFQIKRIANPQQKIVTRLRALGSTKNLPYRYYNKKYDLSQSLFPTNLQLPDTFEIPSVKESHNATRDSVYGVNPITNLPYLRHVKGETNDAYIDKNDDAENSTEGIREDCARWDGSNSDLPEIYPTIEEATYGELRGALVEDQDGNTGSGSFPGYDNDERVDELLAIGYMSDGSMVDDANQGGGILPESGTTGTGIPRSAVISQKVLNYNSVNYGDFTYNNSSHSVDYLSGPACLLFTVQNVNPGRYAIVPTEPSYDSVKYVFNISSQQSGISAYVGFMIIIRQTSKSTGNTKTIATYFSDFTSLSRGETKEVSLPEIPDVKEGSSAKVLDVTVTDTSDISVMFVPLMRNVIVPTGFTDNFAFIYHVGRSSSDTTYPYEPEYTWKSLDDDGSVEDIFHVFVKDMGFDFEACFTGDTPTMVMKSGHCVGREFEIGENVEKVTYNGKKGYMLTLHRATDSSLNTYYPSAVDTIEAGDIFVLLNISMPDAYVKMAEVRLLRAATDYLADNCETQFTYQPSIDDIYLRRNYDNMVAEGTPELSIFWRLYAGLKFTFRGIPAHEDDPLPLAELTIEQVSISMGEGLTPKVEMVLNDEVQQTTLQKLTISVDRIYNTLNGGGGSSGDSSAMLISLLNSEGGKRFLSKTKNDAAQGLIQFLAGLQTGDFIHGSQGAQIDAEGKAELDAATIRRYLQSSNFVKGQLGGEGWGIYKNASGYSTMEVDNLIVRMKAIFAELEIRKLSYLGGDYIFSAAGSKIFRVEYIGLDENDQEIVLAQTEVRHLVDNDGNFIMQGDAPLVWNVDIEIDPSDIIKFRCYVYSDDGTTATMNWWRVNDLARCQTFNLKENRRLPSEWETDENDQPTGTYTNAGNRYYWRQVVGVGSATLDDGRTYNYVDLAVHYPLASSEDDDWPAAGDAIVQLGNTEDPQRQNAIEIVVEGDIAPAIIEYVGIDDFNLSTHRRTKLSPKGDELVAKSVQMMVSDEVFVRIPVDRGEWNDQDTYYNYDRVSWNGTLWLCIIPDNYDAEGNRIGITGHYGYDDEDYEPQSGSVYWLAQVSSGKPGAAGQSAASMVCTANPVMVDTDKNKLALYAWNADVKVMIFYNGMRQNIVSFGNIESDGTWTIGTPTIDESGIGHIPLSGESGTVVQSDIVSVVANINDPSGVASNIPVTGTFTVSPTMRGDDGDSVPKVVIVPEVSWLSTDSNAYMPYNYDGIITIKVADSLGNTAQEPESILFDGEPEYSVVIGQTEVVNVSLDNIYHDEIRVRLQWASQYSVRPTDIPIEIGYKFSQDDVSHTVFAAISIRASKQGEKGENAYSLQYSPTVLTFDVDSDDLAVSNGILPVEIRAFEGSQRIPLIDNITNLSCNSDEIEFGETQILTETINGQEYQYAVINVLVWEGYTYDATDMFVSFDLLEGMNDYTLRGGFPIIRNVRGYDGRNGRGISTMTIQYAVSDSATDDPATLSWVPNMPVVPQRYYLWTKTTVTYTDGETDVFYAIMRQGGDGENGTSVTIKGKAVGHTAHKSDLNNSSEKGLWLVDENGGTPTSVAATVDTSTTPWTENTNLSAGDGYIVESTGHLWVYTTGAWIDAGRVKGEDGRPAYIHYAWANSSDGSQDFTIAKEEGEEFYYMGICTDNYEADPGSESRPMESPWEAYDWNYVRGGDGDKGTTVKGKAIAYINDTNASSFAFNYDGYYLADLEEYTISLIGVISKVQAGQGLGHRLVIKLANTYTFPDPEEGDAYTIDGILWSSVDLHWTELGRFNGESIHYAWADSLNSNGYPIPASEHGFVKQKLATEDKAYIGIYADSETEDSDNPADYNWTRVKGNDIVSTDVFYAVSTDGQNPPEDAEWSDSIPEVPPLYWLWTKTVITFFSGEPLVSYSVAFSGKEGQDGRSVTILGTVDTYDDLPIPDARGYIIINGNEVELHPSDGIIVLEDGHLCLWIDGEWIDAGKFNGEDGHSSYTHIAWANDIGSTQADFKDFTTSKDAGIEFEYIGILVDEVPGDSQIATDYSWKRIRGAEGRMGTQIKGGIIKKIPNNYIETISTLTEDGWYAVDNPEQKKDKYGRYDTSDTIGIRDITACLRRRLNAGWSKNTANVSYPDGNGIVYPQEGDAFIDENGELWSYIEAKWVSLGQYLGNAAYLHLAWANNVVYTNGEITQCDGFTVSKNAAQDYPYVGFCSNNNEEDPTYGYGEDHPTEPWKYYTWQRLRGLGQPLIDFGTDQAVVDADSEGSITSISAVSGLPTSVKVTVEGNEIPVANWDENKSFIRLVTTTGTRSYSIRRSFTDSSIGIYIASANSSGNSVSLTWGYRAQGTNQHPPIALRQIKVDIVATYANSQYTASKTMPVIINKAGRASLFRVQYSPTSTGPWYDSYEAGRDKWMHISDDGGASWGKSIKITATDMNVKGEAYFHSASVPSKPSGWDDNHIGLVDTIGSGHAYTVKWNGSSRTDTAATIGDCYILRDENSAYNGHLFIATENGWQDIGQITGADGQNAVVATLNPTNIILAQPDTESGLLPNFSTTVLVADGSQLTTDFTIGTISTHEHCNVVSVSDGVVTFEAQTHEITVTDEHGASIRKTVNYESGFAIIPVTYKGTTWQLKFNWYANLLGTWKQTIIGDVNKMFANKATFVYNEKTEEVELIQEQGDFVLSASKIENMLTRHHVGANDDEIADISYVNQTADGIRTQVASQINGIAQSVSNIQQTANQIQTTVSNLQVDAENMFAFSNPIIFANSSVPYIQGYGIEGVGNLNRIAHIGTNGVGGKFVVTFEARMQSYAATINVDICDVNPFSDGETYFVNPNNQEKSFRVTLEWAKKTLFFDIPNSNSYIQPTSFDGFLDFFGNTITSSNRLYVRNIMISRGDCRPTGFNISPKDMEANIAGDVLSFVKHDNVVIQSEKYKGYPVYKMHVTDSLVETDMLFRNGIILKQNQCYSMSFYARATQDCHIACFMYGTGSTVNGSIYPQLFRSQQPILNQGEMSSGNATDGCTYIRLTNTYKRYTIYWYNTNANARNVILGRVNGSWQDAAELDVYITGVEFREGYWTVENLNSTSMIRQTATEIEMKVNETGINIEDGTITLNANNTTITGDLSLFDNEQGLVLYDDDRLARVSIKSDELGNIGTYDFGSQIIAKGQATAVNNVVQFGSLELGNVTSGSTVRIPLIAVNTTLGSSSRTVNYSYSIYVNGVEIGSAVTGTVTFVGSFTLPSLSRTTPSSGALTMRLTLTNVVGGGTFNVLVQSDVAGVGLNKIGKDGAVFAKDSTHYNWFGSDKTELRQGNRILTLSENGLVYRGCEVGRLPVRTLTGNTIDLSASDLNNIYDEFLLVNAGSSEVGIILPQPNTLIGKKYYIKSLRENGTYIHCAGRIIKQDSRAAIDYTEIGNRSMIFISIGQYWIVYYCG